MFQFSLEPVLDIRRREEEVEQQRLAKAQRDLDRVTRYIEWLRARQADAARARAEMMARQYNPRAMSLYEDFDRDSRERIEAAAELADRAREEVERRRRDLLEATKRRQTMDELKKAEHEAYLEEERLAERKQNDEVAIFGYVRQRAEKSAGLKEE